MTREQFIRFISENDKSVDIHTLRHYPDEKLREVKESIKARLIAAGKNICNTCNGNGTVLNIECESCKGKGAID